MASGIPDYPWFGVIEGDDIEQGDIVENFPVFLPPDDLVVDAGGKPSSTTQMERAGPHRDVAELRLGEGPGEG